MFTHGLDPKIVFGDLRKLRYVPHFKQCVKLRPMLVLLRNSGMVVKSMRSGKRSCGSAGSL